MSDVNVLGNWLHGVRCQKDGQFELNLPTNEAFHLFTAQGERLWVPEWSPTILGKLPQYKGLVFLTGHHGDHTIWTVIEHNISDGHVLYSRVTPGSRAGTVEVRVTANENNDGGCVVKVAYDMTALSEAGELAMKVYSDFDKMMNDWKSLVNEFLLKEGAREALANVAAGY